MPNNLYQYPCTKDAKMSVPEQVPDGCLAVGAVLHLPADRPVGGPGTGTKVRPASGHLLPVGGGEITFPGTPPRKLTNMGSCSWNFYFLLSELLARCKFFLEMNLQFINIIGDTLTNLADFSPFVRISL